MSSPKSRPKRRKTIRKEESIHIRVTAEQKETLQAAAERDGSGLSVWMLAAAMRAARQQEGERARQA